MLRSLWPEGQGLVQGGGPSGSYRAEFPLPMHSTEGPGPKWKGHRASVREARAIQTEVSSARNGMSKGGRGRTVQGMQREQHGCCLEHLEGRQGCSAAGVGLCSGTGQALCPQEC